MAHLSPTENLALPQPVAFFPPLPPEWRARQAALHACLEHRPFPCFRWQSLSSAQWRRLLRWLDISGLALYFLDRMTALRRTGCLPAEVLSRLQTNLADNAARTRGLIAESVAIQAGFQAARLRYANMKGLSLVPDSVPRPELRSQFDLDYLVAEESARQARSILENRGYRLYLVGGRSWEFKRNETPRVTLNDLYKADAAQQVELHVEPCGTASSVWDRLEIRELYGCPMPVLSPVDLFLGQALHAFKHVCSEFSRASHLVELRRAVLRRRHDHGFWRELRMMARGNPRAGPGLGVVVLLMEQVMGMFAPAGLMEWTCATLPQPARLWVERYGARAIYGGFPGSKLYLLLQRELESAGVPPKRSLRRSLLPVRLPPPVVRALPGENLSLRLARYRLQLSFVVFRLRFHLVEGLRYLWESRRWRHDRPRPTNK